MKPLIRIEGVAAPLLIDDINTDMIAPTRPRAGMTASKMAEKEFDPAALFAPLRYLNDGSENPDFILNSPAYKAAKILIAGRNFGCGSSREQAVWLLADFGIECIIAPGFGGIFFDSCFKNGILPIVLPEDEVRTLAGKATETATFNVDVAARVIEGPEGSRRAFDLPEFRRAALLAGVDDIEMTLRRDAELKQFVARDRSERPWIYVQEVSS
jgi:3-isopropylmalate/(R)-2-methylmalate dehydratase small subunit